MTEEQIKQNSEEYSKKHYGIPFEDNSSMNVEISEESYIAGAHSRDEEIEELKKQLVAMTRLKNSFAGGVDILDNDNKKLKEELDKL